MAGDVSGNLGDMAIARSICDHIRSQINGVEIELVADRQTGPARFPDARIIAKGIAGLPHRIQAVLGCDLLICGGGGLFQDDDSRIKMPYWSIRILLARILGARVIGYCLGVGPLTHFLSRFFCRLAFSCMDVISVRDPVAAEVAEKLTGKPVLMVPDPALALEPACRPAAENLLRAHNITLDDSPLIGVAVRKWFHRRGSFVPNQVAFRLGLKRTGGGQKLDKMTGVLAGLLDDLIDLHGGHVVFLPTYNVAHEGDDQVCEQIAGKMRSKSKSVIKISDPRLYKAVAGRLSVMLGGRMHPTIFAAAMGSPVVGLAYNPKFLGFFRLIGCPENIMSVDDLVERQQSKRLFDLISVCLQKPPGGAGAAVVSGLIRTYRDFNAFVCTGRKTA